MQSNLFRFATEIGKRWSLELRTVDKIRLKIATISIWSIKSVPQMVKILHRRKFMMIVPNAIEKSRVNLGKWRNSHWWTNSDMKVIYSASLNCFTSEWKCMISERWFKCIKWFVSVLMISLIVWIDLLMSSVKQIRSQHDPVMRVVLQIARWAAHKNMTYCIAKAIKYPIRFLQGNGNLSNWNKLNQKLTARSLRGLCCLKELMTYHMEYGNWKVSQYESPKM